MLSIEIANRQRLLKFDAPRMRSVIEAVLHDAGIKDAEVSIALVDDREIHELNRQFLEHDYATDVLSFRLSEDGARLEGEVIASAETATRVAAQLGWPGEDELLLYVVHGVLHLVGYDDLQADKQADMRAAERRYLALVGLSPPIERKD